MSVILTQQLCRSYGARRGIRDVDLQVGPCEIFGFLGPNGAGKSTTIRLLLGFLKADSGTATIFGQDCWRHSAAIKQDTGYVAGDVRLYPWLTVRRALRFISQVRGRDLLSAGLQLAGRFQLEPDLPVRRMSRGNRQKVALVLALAHQPRLLILDEPTSGLDPLMQDVLCQCLREHAAAGHTVLFSSHTLSEVESLCDRIAIVRDGRIVADESLTLLRSRAPRIVTITLSAAESDAPRIWPDWLQLVRRHGNTCQLRMTGPTAEFLRWAAAQDFADVSISPPSLEELFRRYYDTAAEATTCGDC